MRGNQNSNSGSLAPEHAFNHSFEPRQQTAPCFCHLSLYLVSLFSTFFLLASLFALCISIAKFIYPGHTERGWAALQSFATRSSAHVPSHFKARKSEGSVPRDGITAHFLKRRHFVGDVEISPQSHCSYKVSSLHSPDN